MLCAAALAQGELPAQEDVFASIHESLNDAADRSLAVLLGQKPWMAANEIGTRAEEGPFGHPSKDSGAKVRAAVARVNQLRPIVEPLLQDEGVPRELSAVVLVESGGLIDALSPKGARGIWQFMPDTARRYGLTVGAEHDDRTDVVKSTRAAGRYLRDLYAKFGDWSLALAAYNAGEVSVTSAMSRARSRNFGSLSSGRLLPAETRNYVPAVVAAMDRLQHPILGDSDELQSKSKHVVYAMSASGD
jgi:hypothetical protein